MYHDKPRVPLSKKWLRPLVIVLILGVLCWGGILWQQNVTRDLDQQAAQQLKETVQRAAVQCYAVEGVFPRKPGTFGRKLRVTNQPRKVYRDL